MKLPDQQQLVSFLVMSVYAVFSYIVLGSYHKVLMDNQEHWYLYCVFCVCGGVGVLVL